MMMKGLHDKEKNKYPVNPRFPLPPWNSNKDKADEDKAKEKGDHLTPTNMEDYDTLITSSKKRENFSHKEMQDKLNVYSRAMNKMDRYFVIQQLKEKYKTDTNKFNDNRIKQDAHYGKGERSGLPQTHHEIIKDDRDWVDQNKRDQLVKKGKEAYNKDGLKKTYTSKHGKLGKGLGQTSAIPKHWRGLRRTFREKKTDIERTFNRARDRSIHKDKSKKAFKKEILGLRHAFHRDRSIPKYWKGLKRTFREKKTDIGRSFDQVRNKINDKEKGMDRGR